jgi:hypothetical protein
VSKVSKLICDQCGKEMATTDEAICPPGWITLDNIYIGGVPIARDMMGRNCLDFCCSKCLISFFQLGSK